MKSCCAGIADRAWREVPGISVSTVAERLGMSVPVARELLLEASRRGSVLRVTPTLYRRLRAPT